MNFMLNDTVTGLLDRVELPEMFPVHQSFPSGALDASLIPALLKEQLLTNLRNDCILPGMHIAITAGSRRIANSVTILRILVEFVREKGAYPFLIPAMGSHGGATAEGQTDMLKTLGITEESVGCPICSSMETMCIGRNDRGEETFVDKFACSADGIIVFNRVKPHSGFHGKCESGLVKMMAVGLGKQAGASRVHAKYGTELGESIYYFGKKILDTLPVLFGVAVIEDAYDQTAEINVVKREDILETDSVFREKALSMMPRILFSSCDVLIVNQMGKDICGSGMDNNIIGRFHNNMYKGWIDSELIGVLDITPESHGNANGIGRADIISGRLFEKIDLNTTYPNALTTRCYFNAAIPMVMPTDELVFKACVNGCRKTEGREPRIIFIRDTIHLENIWLSKPYWDEAEKKENITVLGKPTDRLFDESGNILLSFT